MDPLTRPDNLAAPLPGDRGAHGDFDARSRRSSSELWMRLNAGKLAAGAAAAAAMSLVAWRGAARMIRTALLATLGLRGFDALERNLLGHRPAYDVDTMGKRLFGSARAGQGAALDLRTDAGGDPEAAPAAPPCCSARRSRWGSWWRCRGSAPPPPARKWKRGEVPLLFAHATAFALAVDLL